VAASSSSTSPRSVPTATRKPKMVSARACAQVKAAGRLKRSLRSAAA
jgi:hypothetical protein